jgi:ribosomal protein S18 acetylase RimI-like enzyme
MYIKNASLHDIPLIRSLAMQTWPKTYTPIIGREQVAYMLEKFYSTEELTNQLNSGNHNFIIACNNDLPVAFAAFGKIDDRIFKLHKLYITPDCQGTGIGSFVLKHIIDVLKAQEIKKLRLNVNRYNIAAVSFYKKQGFLHIADEDIDIGNGFYMNDHMMELDLIDRD